MTQTPPAPDDSAVAAEILRQTAACGEAGSVSPNAIAQALAGDGEATPWRPLLGRVRQAATRLAAEGRIEILRKGKPLPPGQAPHGVVRLRCAAATTPGAAGG